MKIIQDSKGHVDDIDDLAKQLQEYRTLLGLNKAHAIQKMKHIEATPTWMNRHKVPAATSRPAPPPLSVANIVAMLTALSKSSALDGSAVDIINNAIQLITATTNPTAQSPGNAISPIRKKTRVTSPTAKTQLDVDMDEDLIEQFDTLPVDLDSNGEAFGLNSSSSDGILPPSAPTIQKKKKKKKQRR